jgi:hypothetical protein
MIGKPQPQQQTQKLEGLVVREGERGSRVAHLVYLSSISIKVFVPEKKSTTEKRKSHRIFFNEIEHQSS